MAKTEEALRVEVLRVCRNYYSQSRWSEEPDITKVLFNT